MYGIFNLTFGAGDALVEKESFNHLTKNGMDALFNRKYLDQPNVNGTQTLRYKDNINYFFVIIDDGQPLGFDPQSQDVTFAQIARFPAAYNEQVNVYDQYSSLTRAVTNQLYPEGIDSVKILGAGVAYKEVGGDGSKDFVWSFTFLDTPYIAQKENSGDYPDRAKVWQCSYSYKMVFTGNPVPELNINIGGIDYTFIRNPLGNEQNVGYMIDAGSIIDRNRADYAGFTVNGGAFTPPSIFKEIKNTDPLIRKFEIGYQNKRATNSVDITGFALRLGNNIFSYRLEYDKYIVLDPGKTLKFTVTTGIENGYPAAIANNGIDYTPTVYYNSELGNVSDLMTYNYRNSRLDKVVITGSANTPNQGVFVNNIEPDNSNVYLSGLSTSKVYNTELTKIQLGLGNNLGRGIYTLIGGNPSVVPIQKPDISAADNGWRVENDVIVYRINVPADITHLQVALDDGIWHDFPVVAGASNDIPLTKRFIYNSWFFLRWKNNDVTGVITKYIGRFKTAVLVEPFYSYQPQYRGGNSVNASKYYRMFRLGASGLPCSPIPALDNTSYSGFGGINANVKSVYQGGYEVSDYNGPFPGTAYTLLPNFKYLQNDLTFKAIPEVFAGTYFANGNESELPWKIRPTAPLVGDIAEVIPKRNLPRNIKLDLKAYPTEVAPNKIDIQCTLETRKARLSRVHDNVVLDTITAPVNGSKVQFSIADKMFNHLDYSIDYLNEADVVVSPAPVVFKGKSLDVPAAITDYTYDDVGFIIQFTTPDRAVRASIKQYNIEVFAFECVPGGLTKFYMSKALNLTQRYELWLYNANNETWDAPFVMVDVPETDEKPTSTGPYTFPEWTDPTTSDVVTDLYGNGVFVNIQRWVEFDYNVNINGLPTDQVITRNEFGIITSILFNAGLQRFAWYTGYDTNDTTYDNPPTNVSSISINYMDTTTPLVIDVWHEWERYAFLDEASFGRYNSGNGTFTPYYGQTTGKFQKTEIIDGYIRNTLRIRNKPSGTVPRVCPLWHLFPGNYSSAFRSANIYLLAGKLLGSPNVNINGYYVDQYQAIIDGKAAKWELTKDENEIVIKARCFNDDQTSFTYDATRPDRGWTFDNYDPLVDGTEGAELIYHTLQFCLSKSQWDGQLVSYSPGNTYGDKPLNADMVAGTYVSYCAIFAKVNPYARLPNWIDDIGSNPSYLHYNGNNPSSVNQEYYRFQDAYIGVTDYAALLPKVADSVVYMNGEIGTITNETVTLPFTPTLANLNLYINTINPGDGFDIAEPTLVEFSYEAIVLTAGDFVVSNRSNPYVWTLDAKPAGWNGDLKVTLGRKNFTTEAYYNGMVSNNANGGQGVWFNLTRQYWASMSMILHSVPHKLMKMADELPDPNSAVVDESKAQFNNKVIHTLVSALMNIAVWRNTETNEWDADPELLAPIDGFLIIDGESYSIQGNPDILTSITGKHLPFQRDITTWLAKVFKTSDPSVYIEYNLHGDEHYVGWIPGVHKLTMSLNTVDSTNEEVLNTISNFMVDFDNTLEYIFGISKADIGYVDLKVVNYIVSDIGTGFKVNTNAMPFKVLDPAVKVPEYTPVFGPSFNDKQGSVNQVHVGGALNPYYLLANGDFDLSIKLNGVPYDRMEIAVAPYDQPVEGSIDLIDRADDTLLTSRAFYWDELGFSLQFCPFPKLYETYVYAGTPTIEEMGSVDWLTEYNGTRLAFEILAPRATNDTTPLPFVSNGLKYDLLSYGLPMSTFGGRSDRIDSVANGDDVYSRWEIVLGKKPIVEEDFDPSIGDSYFANMTESQLLRLNPSSFGGGGGPGPGPGNDQYYRDAAVLVPNHYQYPYTAFAVTVNGKPAVFHAPEPNYEDNFTAIRLDINQSYPNYGGNNASQNGMSVVRAIYDDGSLEPLGFIDEYYDANFNGPDYSDEGGEGPMMMMGEGEPEPTSTIKAGIYLAKLNTPLLGGSPTFNGTPGIVCDELGVVLIFDFDRGDWVIYTGDTHVDYLIEFRYKRLYDPKDGKANPVLEAEDIGSRYVYNAYWNLTYNNVKLLPNAVHPDKFELSWINRVHENNMMNSTGYKHQGSFLPSGSTLEQHLPSELGLDETYRTLPVAGVTMNNLAVTINGDPAIMDLTNYDSETDSPNLPMAVYTVTEVQENNGYPVRGSMGSITASNAHGTIHYDVATGTWNAVSTTGNENITVGLARCVDVIAEGLPPDMDLIDTKVANGYARMDYNLNDTQQAVAFRLMGNPANNTEPTVVATAPDLSARFIDFSTLPIYTPIAPNYELFDPLDFEMIFNGTDVITPVVTNDTHGVPTEYRWILDPTSGWALVINVVDRSIFTDAVDWDLVSAPEFGLLPITRATNLNENPNTKYFNKVILGVIQWNYKELLDITDTRPLFLDDMNSSRIYLDDYNRGLISSVITQGTKKTVSVAVAFGDDPYVGCKANQPIFGWLPTGYTGEGFGIEDSGKAVDDLAARPLVGDSEHSVEITISASGDTNEQPM